MLHLILILAHKDWRLFWADRRAALLCFAVPVILASAFGAIFHQPTEEIAKLPIAIVNESEDSAVRAFVNNLLMNPRFEATLCTREEAMTRVAERQPAIAVVFDGKFKLPTLTGEKPNLQILHHPLANHERQWAEGVLTEAIIKHLAGGLATLPFHTQTTSVGGPFNSYSHSFSGMSLQYLLFWGMESGLLFLRERRRGVWRRLRTAPVPLTAIVLGKALATATIALLQIAISFSVGMLAFGVTIHGSWLGLLAIAVAISLLAAGTGLLVAAFGGTEARARSICILLILALSMLGGLWLPAFMLPEWVRKISAAVPTSWAMHGLDGVVQGYAFGKSLAVVLGFAMAFILIATVRIRRREMV
jgi:ABC-2 type transport system permease protein